MKYNPPLAGWTGGKSRLVKKLLAEIPEHLCYAEVFCGGAWLYFSKNPSKVEVINDIDREVVNLYRCLKYHYDEVIKWLSFTMPSRVEYDFLKEQDAADLTDIQRACRLFYLIRFRFNGRPRQLSFGYSPMRSCADNGKIEMQLKEANNRLCNTYIECLPYETLIAKYDRETTFFYLDPPYFGSEKAYNDNFDVSDYDTLADILKEIKGKFLLSLNDVPEIREKFKFFNLKEVDTLYTCDVSNNGYKARELFIMNY